MPSFKNIAASAVALAGMATAIPQIGYNGTSTAGAVLATGTGATTAGALTTGVSSNSTSSTAAPYALANSTSSATGALSTATKPKADDSFFCPTLDGQVFVDGLEISYLIECSTNHFGTIIDIAVNITKRAVPTSLADCLTLCDATAGCVGTAFDSDAETCTLFSDLGAAYTDDGVDFAVVVATGATDAATTASAGATLTATQYSTNVVTIHSCAPTVTDCPLDAASGDVVVTQVIPVTSTDYICPTATVIPATPIACGCHGEAATVNAYSASVISTGVSSGSTVAVPYTETVIAIPQPTATTYSTITAAATASAQVNYVAAESSASVASVAGAVAATGGLVTKTGSGASATSSITAYTGAGAQVKAGMGMGAIVAVAAFLL